MNEMDFLKCYARLLDGTLTADDQRIIRDEMMRDAMKRHYAELISAVGDVF